MQGYEKDTAQVREGQEGTRPVVARAPRPRP